MYYTIIYYDPSIIGNKPAMVLCMDHIETDDLCLVLSDPVYSLVQYVIEGHAITVDLHDNERITDDDLQVNWQRAFSI